MPQFSQACDGEINSTYLIRLLGGLAEFTHGGCLEKCQATVNNQQVLFLLNDFIYIKCPEKAQL